MAILAVCGLKREAKIVGIPGVIAVAGGGDAAGLTRKLDALHGDITGVISIGLGGGLSPHLHVGEVVIGERVIDVGESFLPRARESVLALGEVAVAGPGASEGRRGQVFQCNSLWRVALAAKIRNAHQGPIVASDTILENPEAKAALYQSSGALVVDMESAVAARFAAARGVRLAVLRVISDDASHTLPPAARVAMRPDGGIALGRILWSLAKNPLQLPALVRTSETSGRAFAELFRCRDLLGPGLGGIGFASPNL